MKNSIPPLTISYKSARLAISNNLPDFVNPIMKTSFQIFIELAFGLACCMMLIAMIKSISGIEEETFYVLGFQLFFFYVVDYINYKQYQTYEPYNRH